MIRLGIIGCGGMSRSHAACYHNLGPDRVRVTATVDIDPDCARSAAEAFGEGTRAATDYREVLDDVDAVLIVLPHHLHHPVGMACLEAGKHVLMEKPLANSEQECLDLVTAADRAQRVLMVAYVMRYHPLLLRLKQLLDEQTFGQCFHMSVWTEQFTHYPPGHWTRSASTLGGGQLFSHGCHYIDLLLWLMGTPVEGSHVGTNFGTPWMENEGTSNVSLKFANGATAYHFGTWGARGTRLGYAIHAHCTDGMLEVDFRRGQILYHRFASEMKGSGSVEPHIEEGELRETQFGKEAIIAETPGKRTGKHTDKELAHFIECIETGRQPDTDGQSSLHGLRVIWRLYEAEQKGVIADLRDLDHAPAVLPAASIR
ncbi:Gfo/Idh/MocA family protein [Phycisphaerales bacterium AB-hyl4]|uniref:Gfo/Idh/MocA family protein n=1 Tax=Natronomicrosphaera hydrolytica TaxID=3242702 RepID=A0ABV4U2F0_9BACT